MNCYSGNVRRKHTSIQYEKDEKIKAQEDLKEQEMLAQMSEEERQQYIQNKAQKKKDSQKVVAQLLGVSTVMGITPYYK